MPDKIVRVERPATCVRASQDKTYKKLLDEIKTINPIYIYIYI